MTESQDAAVDLMAMIWASARPAGVRIEDGRAVILSPNETTMRANLAALARAYGWDVEEEVVVPGWGRIDIVLRETGEDPILIELKMRLTKPAEVRKAFQQADGYGRWWSRTKSQAVQVVLSAREFDDAAIGLVADAYPEVQFRSVGFLMAMFCHWGNPAARRFTAMRRLEELRTQIAVHEMAVRELTKASERHDAT